jgi:hypothetical protein
MTVDLRASVNTPNEDLKPAGVRAFATEPTLTAQRAVRAERRLGPTDHRAVIEERVVELGIRARRSG